MITIITRKKIISSTRNRRRVRMRIRNNRENSIRRSSLLTRNRMKYPMKNGYKEEFSRYIN